MTLSESKQRELSLLKELKSLNGYFSEYLAATDLDTMEENLLNDYPLFMGTALDVDSLRNEVIRKENECRELTEKNDRLTEECGVLDEQLDDYLAALNSSVLRLAKLKIKFNEPLEENERQAILNAINC